jgi:hypothetical protein
MATSKTKTKATKVTADSFIKKIADEQVREDCRTLVTMMKQVTKAEPVMWGPAIVGFGTWHYKYDSGHEGDICMMGFSPRKQNITLYIAPGFDDFRDELAQLGKHSTGKSCLYIKRLADVDQGVLKQIITKASKQMKIISAGATVREGVRSLRKSSAEAKATKKTSKKASKKPGKK